MYFCGIDWGHLGSMWSRSSSISSGVCQNFHSASLLPTENIFDQLSGEHWTAGFPSCDCDWPAVGAVLCKKYWELSWVAPTLSDGVGLTRELRLFWEISHQNKKRTPSRCAQLRFLCFEPSKRHLESNWVMVSWCQVAQRAPTVLGNFPTLLFCENKESTLELCV